MTESQPVHERIPSAEVGHGPFRDEADVLVDRAAQHDDISKTQSSSNAAVEVSAEHVSELLYESGYTWDPRSYPQGVEYYPAYPDSSQNTITPSQETRE